MTIRSYLEKSLDKFDTCKLSHYNNVINVCDIWYSLLVRSILRTYRSMLKPLLRKHKKIVIITDANKNIMILEKTWFFQRRARFLPTTFPSLFDPSPLFSPFLIDLIQRYVLGLVYCFAVTKKKITWYCLRLFWLYFLYHMVQADYNFDRNIASR